MLTNQSGITPFTYEGVSNQESQPPGGLPGVVENNRKRHFRSAANYSELATATAANTALCFTFRLLQVSAAGYFAIAILNFSYFTITATNEKKPIAHFLTGLSVFGGSAATLSEPIGDFLNEQSVAKNYHAEVSKLTPHNATNFLIIPTVGIALLIGLILVTKKD